MWLCVRTALPSKMPWLNDWKREKVDNIHSSMNYELRLCTHEMREDEVPSNLLTLGPFALTKPKDTKNGNKGIELLDSLRAKITRRDR